MTEQEFRDKLRAEGYNDPVLVEWQAEKLNDTHTHEFGACGLVLSGQFTLTTAAGARTCEEGDTFALEANMPHAEHVGRDGARLLVGRTTAAT